MWAWEITKWILNDYTADILLKMNQSCKYIDSFTVFDSENELNSELCQTQN